MLGLTLNWNWKSWLSFGLSEYAQKISCLNPKFFLWGKSFINIKVSLGSTSIMSEFVSIPSSIFFQLQNQPQRKNAYARRRSMKKKETNHTSDLNSNLFIQTRPVSTTSVKSHENFKKPLSLCSEKHLHASIFRSKGRPEPGPWVNE